MKRERLILIIIYNFKFTLLWRRLFLNLILKSLIKYQFENPKKYA